MFTLDTMPDCGIQTDRQTDRQTDAGQYANAGKKKLTQNQDCSRQL